MFQSAEAVSRRSNRIKVNWQFWATAWIFTFRWWIFQELYENTFWKSLDEFLFKKAVKGNLAVWLKSWLTKLATLNEPFWPLLLLTIENLKQVPGEKTCHLLTFATPDYRKFEGTAMCQTCHLEWTWLTPAALDISGRLLHLLPSSSKGRRINLPESKSTQNIRFPRPSLTKPIPVTRVSNGRGGWADLIL